MKSRKIYLTFSAKKFLNKNIKNGQTSRRDIAES